MTCKYLTTKNKQLPPEIGGSPLPQPPVKFPACGLGRVPDTIGWSGKCQTTNPNGPCWFWIEEQGTKPDPDF